MAILLEEMEYEAKILFTNQRLLAEYFSAVPSWRLPYTPSSALLVVADFFKSGCA
jgi:hypothetical protein